MRSWFAFARLHLQMWCTKSYCHPSLARLSTTKTTFLITTLQWRYCTLILTTPPFTFRTSTFVVYASDSLGPFKCDIHIAFPFTSTSSCTMRFVVCYAQAGTITGIRSTKEATQLALDAFFIFIPFSDTIYSLIFLCTLFIFALCVNATNVFNNLILKCRV